VRRPAPPPLRSTVRYNSPELVCLHEAGHAGAAVFESSAC
jgi:hypothetical protein